ncbi:MAG: Rpn family recombination-promoting nuclease/putative transposase [Myxococcota bacterium]
MRKTKTPTRTDGPFFDPTNDVAFRKLFGDKKHSAVIIDFLNAALEFKGQKRIARIDKLGEHQLPPEHQTKETILDVHCHDQRGRSYIIEMQNNGGDAFDKRATYYVAHNVVGQLGVGDAYSSLRTSYFVGILGFSFVKGNTNYLSHHRLCDLKTGKQTFDTIHYAFVELPKFHLKLNQLKNDAQRWVYFLRHAPTLKEIPKQLDTPALHEAFTTLREHAWTPTERRAYVRSMIARTDREMQMSYARRKGLEKGREEGREEERRALVSNLIKSGMHPKATAKATGLSVADIERLKQP